MSLAFSYCGDHLTDYNIIYLSGTGGALVNMDIDCDGTQGGPADDGRCGKSDDTQSITSFQSVVKSYNRGINDLDAKIHSYVVFGNTASKPGGKVFDPESVGIRPLSIMAVVCGNKMVRLTFGTSVLPLHTRGEGGYCRRWRNITLISPGSSTEYGAIRTATMARTPLLARHPSL